MGSSSSYISGFQPKIKIGNMYYKQDIAGYESISEVVVSELCGCIEDFNYVKYYWDKLELNYNVYDSCYSYDFIGDSEECTVLGILKRLFKEDILDTLSGESLLKEVVLILSDYTGISTKEILVNIGRICYLDYITLNEDRHFNNISLLCKNNIFTFSPVFDNGLSLLSNLDKYPMHDKKIGVAMRSARSKPFCKVFKNQVDLFREYVNPLVINVDLLQQKLSTIEEYVPFKKDCFKRACSILARQLNNTEGTVWVKK